ncbi:MAG: F420-dependent methylenetetrahydromethanopterin dehydrogenase [Candidatus Hydrothermarchaeales archaeon]
MVKIGVLKTGNIGCSPLLEFLLDERADRADIDVTVLTSGAKMGTEDVEEVANNIIKLDPDLILYSTPNPSAPGPAKAIDVLVRKKAIVISDGAGVKLKEELEKKGLGYIFVKADPMIGARREFLDPIEMALFNSDVMKVLAVTGVFGVLQNEIDKAIDAIKDGDVYLPRVVADRDLAIEHSGLKNPYAKAKAMASFEMAERVGALNIEGCFATKDPEKYIPLVASAHELLRAAARLADEAREIEKFGDEVLRKAHSREGKTLEKRKLMERPS